MCPSQQLQTRDFLTFFTSFSVKLILDIHSYSETSQATRQNKGLKDRWLLSAGQKYCRMLQSAILSTCINSYKPSVLFVGCRQTVQTQTRRSRMHCLLAKCSIKIWIKIKKYHPTCIKKEMDCSNLKRWEIPFSLNGLSDHLSWNIFWGLPLSGPFRQISL